MTSVPDTCMNFTPEVSVPEKPGRNGTGTRRQRRMLQEASLPAQLQKCCQANKTCLALASALCTLACDYKIIKAKPNKELSMCPGQF